MLLLFTCINGTFLVVCVLQCTHFFFLMEGEVKLERGGVCLGTLGEGSFVVSKPP